MADNNNIVSGGTSQCAAVTNFFLNIRNNGAFRHSTEGENVSDCQICLFASIDELTGVHSFVGDESFGAELESVGITESNFGKRCTTTRVVDDFLDYTTKISMSFRILTIRSGFGASKIHREL